jgi:serine/threonine protein kinase
LHNGIGRGTSTIIPRGDTYSSPEALAVELVKQMLLGLKTLHSANVVHLDIKPENVFIKNGTYKLGDLGHACLARMTTNTNTNIQNTNTGITAHGGGGSSTGPPTLARSSSIMSTASMMMVGDDDDCSDMAAMAALMGDVDEGDSRYMARELLQDDYRRLPKADMFSLGASAYEVLLARQLPANGPEWDDMRSGTLTGKPGPNGVALSDTSPACQQLIGLLMHPEAARRPSAQALLASGGPGGILRSDVENELARERSAANEYKKQLEQLRRKQAPARLIRRVNTM